MVYYHKDVENNDDLKIILSRLPYDSFIKEYSMAFLYTNNLKFCL